MTDEQFDALAKSAMAHDAGEPSERVWGRVRPVRWSWFPTVREILLCGCVSGLVLLGVGLGMGRRPEPNPVIQSAMHDETRTVLASVTRVSGAGP